jgi:hypothetical protein
MNDLSVVFCGPVELPDAHFPGTAAAAARIRELLPDAELLLATWEEAELDEQFDRVFDRVIRFPDPGSTVLGRLSGWECKVNYRRLACAAWQGAKAARRRWLWRIRCDCYAEHVKALEVYAREHAEFKPNKYFFFSSPILIPNLYTRDSRRGGAMLHPSDIMHIGRTKDLVAYFDAAVRGPFYKPSLGVGEGGELFPEQMMWISALRRFRPNPKWRNARSVSPALVVAANLSLLGNFLLADFAQLGLISKKDFSTKGWPKNCFSPKDFSCLRRQSFRRPTLFRSTLIARTARAQILNFYRNRVVSLVSDWSPSGKRYKVGLLRGTLAFFFCRSSPSKQ